MHFTAVFQMGTGAGTDIDTDTYRYSFIAKRYRWVSLAIIWLAIACPDLARTQGQNLAASSHSTTTGKAGGRPNLTINWPVFFKNYRYALRRVITVQTRVTWKRTSSLKIIPRLTENFAA